LVRFSASTTTAAVPQPDAYSLRLASGRVLYDEGTLVQHCPALAKLAPGGALHLHPGEIDRHGLRSGGQVRVVAGSRSVALPVVADDRVPRGSAFVPFNQAGAGAADLIDAASFDGEGVVRVRLETVGE
jgi:predicted molibdopterin-dependent oxidoreductase YjgC